MTENTVVRVRIDGRIKDETSAGLASIGLIASGAFRTMMTRIAREKALPFEISVPNQDTVAAMREARKGGMPRRSKPRRQGFVGRREACRTRRITTTSPSMR